MDAPQASASTAETTERLYDQAASNWQRTEPVLLSDYTARPFLLDWCGGLEGATVLDLGCGEGYVARQLRERGAASVFGIDISSEMITRARAEEARRGQGISYWAGDATDLSRFDDDSVDLTVAVFLFNYLTREQTAATMREVVRVLRPGGTFVFAVPHPSLAFLRPQEAPFYFDPEEFGYFSARNEQLEGRIWRRDGDSVRVRCVHKTVGDYFACLRDAGFDALPEVEELRVTDEHVALDANFFGPLADQPLHMAFRIRAPE